MSISIPLRCEDKVVPVLKHHVMNVSQFKKMVPFYTVRKPLTFEERQSSFFTESGNLHISNVDPTELRTTLVR